MKNIEWSEKSINTISGCNGPGGVRCPGCYAESMSKRLAGRYGYPKKEDDPFTPTFHPDKLERPLKRKKRTRYFFGSMCDWLDPGVETDWRKQSLEMMVEAKQHIFLTLTKQYEHLWKIAYDSPGGEIPPNVWVGISVTNRSQVWGIKELVKVEAPMRFISFEPLLEELCVELEGIQWIIIGARSKQGKVPYFRPEKSWVKKLVDKAHWVPPVDTIPVSVPATDVFLKPNLGDYVAEGWFEERLEEIPFAQ